MVSFVRSLRCVRQCGTIDSEECQYNMVAATNCQQRDMILFLTFLTFSAAHNYAFETVVVIGFHSAALFLSR